MVVDGSRKHYTYKITALRINFFMATLVFAARLAKANFR